MKYKIKKISKILICICLLVTITGCGKKKTQYAEQEKMETIESIKISDNKSGYTASFSYDNSNEVYNVTIDNKSENYPVINYKNNNTKTELKMKTYFYEISKDGYKEELDKYKTSKYYEAKKYGNYPAYTYSKDDDNDNKNHIYINIKLNEKNNKIIVLLFDISSEKDSDNLKNIISTNDIFNMFDSITYTKE